MPKEWRLEHASRGNYSFADVNGKDPKNAKTQPSGSHSHDFELSIKEGTIGQSNDQNRPRWYALAFIIKLADEETAKTAQ